MLGAMKNALKFKRERSGWAEQINYIYSKPFLLSAEQLMVS